MEVVLVVGIAIVVVKMVAQAALATIAFVMLIPAPLVVAVCWLKQQS